ncbi:conserved hypothetical protein [Streptomyces sp. SPB78]|uniref:hypothetical protein n=1 Tax=Streptomyces sp. (strain SPB78) TaxID=591157 RepID=UPI0001B54EBE|nr:hypothetical protein [Streptomyces sp. SPB78]EFL01372.1 conserved hypothetical protein [Streptomyces sp. SPB78]
MTRLRLTITHCPRRALTLSDTPRPDCPQCAGEGFMREGYLIGPGTYRQTAYTSCPCWDRYRCRTLLPLPHLPLRRRTRDLPPF